jgi:hypothetical protein
MTDMPVDAKLDAKLAALDCAGVETALPQIDPTPQYWADQVLWRSYKAALAFAVREERRRCRQIVKSFENSESGPVREQIRELISQLDTDNISVTGLATV